MTPVASPLSLHALPARDRERLRSGMRAPTVATIPAGAPLYRFASSYDRYRKAPIPASRWATGPWWFDQQGFDLIRAEHAASLRAHGNDPKRALTFGFLARQAAAVKQEWSNVDVLVIARAATAFEVFTGKGRAQHEVPDRSTGFWNYDVRFTWTGWERINQIFIPFLDLNRPGHRADGTLLFRVMQEDTIASQQLF